MNRKLFFTSLLVTMVAVLYGTSACATALSQGDSSSVFNTAVFPGHNEVLKGYKFTFVIEGNTDSIMYMGNYYAGKTYATDTARLNKKGQFVFEQKSRPLYPGLYFFTNPAGNYVEFAVYGGEKPHFTFSTKGSQWTTNMKVKGSKQNELFFEYHNINRHYYDLLDDARATMNDSIYKIFTKKTMLQFDSAKLAFIDKHPQSLISVMMRATREPHTPAYDAQGNKLSDRERYEYYMSHYFDNMALDDDALVRTPAAIFQQRVMDYYDKYLRNAMPETIIRYTDSLLARAEKSPEKFKCMVHTISEKYLQSNIMSYDAIYVHMIKNYYANGKAYWASPTTIDENVTRAEKWDKLLIGKQAPELVLKDREGLVHSLHGQQHKYTLLAFWSPTCGHCKTMIPALYNKLMEIKDSVDIVAFTILSEPDDATRAKWNDFLKKHNMTDPAWLNLDGGEANIDWHDVYDIVTTPQIYLLDKDKNILAKKLNAELFASIIETLERSPKQP